MDKYKEYEEARKKLRNIIKNIIIKPYKITLEGEDMIKGPAVIAINHKRWIDPVLVLGSIDDDIRFIAKNEVSKIPFIGKKIKDIFGLILANRNGADLKTVKESFKVIDEGYKVGIFPEGTRYGLLKKKKMHSGAVNIALTKKVPIIPVGISGSAKIFRKTVIRVGKPIYVSDMIDETNEKRLEVKRLTELMQKEILNLVDKNEYKEYR